MDSEDLPSIFDPATLTRRGFCPITQAKSQHTFNSHQIYFEMHGNGPEKIVFIMGFNISSFGWAYQVPSFAESGKYTVLVLDNRGCGYSSVPNGPYKTSEMATDVVALLDYVAWTEPRSVHVVGVSMGGMIAQELASKIPERICSLLLGVTTSSGPLHGTLPMPLHGARILLREIIEPDEERRIALELKLTAPDNWLEAESADGYGKTNAEVLTEHLRARSKVMKPPTLLGSLYQACAGATHHVDSERLKKLSSSIPKVTLLAGECDILMDPSNTHYMQKWMPQAEMVQWANAGHGVYLQCKVEFRELIERNVREGREKSTIL